jgi:ATP-dependent Clp protease, protease subunit
MKSKTQAHDHSETSNPKYDDSYVLLSRDRIIFMTENFSSESCSDLVGLLLYYDHLSNEPIDIYIHSNGGDASGLAQVYDTIQMIKSPVRTFCMGKAYSAGAVLLAAGTKGQRYAFQNSKIMIHGIQCTFPIIGHDTKNSENYFKFLDLTNQMILEILADHTGQSLAKISADCSKDHYMNAKEAKKYGLIDQII